MSQEIANLFNSAIVSSAVSAAFELGILDDLHIQGKIHIPEYSQTKNLHSGAVNSILSALSVGEICEFNRELETYYKGRLFAELYTNKGCFMWMVRGYGYLLQNLATVAKNENRTGNFMKPDGKYIAMATRDHGKQFVDKYFEDILDESPPIVAADLGCGSAERLINLAKKYPSMRGVGVDINENSVSFARTAVEREGLSDRIKVLQGDMRKLEALPELREVDVLFSFFSGHDLWPKENCLQVMHSLRDAFPNIKRFLICDTYRSEVVPSKEVPVFTLGFETIHGVMGQYIPSLTEWMELFRESGWNCINRQDVETPYSTIFDLRPALI